MTPSSFISSGINRINHTKVARQSILLNVAGVAAFAFIIYLLTAISGVRLNGAPLMAASVLLALVPASLFLLAFVRADSIEPEPRALILGIFALGGVLAFGIGQPVIRTLFQVQEWSDTNVLTQLAAAILIAGVIQQFLIYAAVRYSIFHSAHFNERVDGIVYGAAAGLGYATAFNLLYVTGNGGVNLGIGALRVATEALAFGCLGGLSGYCIARAKLDKMGPVWLPMGLLASAVLNGVIDVLLNAAPMLGNGFSFNPWLGLIAAILIAGLIFFLLFQLIERLNRATHLAVGQVTESPLDPILIGRGQRHEPEWMVWVVVIVLLLAGGLIGNGVLSRTKTATVNGISLSYPARWVADANGDAVLSVLDRQHGAFEGPRISLRQSPLDTLLPIKATSIAGMNTDTSLATLTTNWSIQQGKTLPGFRLLDLRTTTVDGHKAMQMEYVFLLDSPQGAVNGAMPALMRAVDTLVRVGTSNTVHIITFAAEARDFDHYAGTLDQTLSSVKVS